MKTRSFTLALVFVWAGVSAQDKTDTSFYGYFDAYTDCPDLQRDNKRWYLQKMSQKAEAKGEMITTEKELQLWLNKYPTDFRINNSFCDLVGRFFAQGKIFDDFWWLYNQTAGIPSAGSFRPKILEKMCSFFPILCELVKNYNDAWTESQRRKWARIIRGEIRDSDLAVEMWMIVMEKAYYGSALREKAKKEFNKKSSPWYSITAWTVGLSVGGSILYIMEQWIADTIHPFD